MSRDWIQTLEGRKLTPRNLQVEQVGSIAEIAHALAGKVRFTGQIAQRYTVAEHCVRGSQELPLAYAGAFLLHELSEVYLPDVAAPLKPFLRVENPHGAQNPLLWEELERHHTRVILESLGLSSFEPLIYSREVCETDLRMLLTEKRDLCSLEPEPWGIPVEPYAATITPWAPHVAESSFLARFDELFQVRR